MGGTSLSAGLRMRSMMLLMMLLSAPLFTRRNVRTKHLGIPPILSALNGQRSLHCFKEESEEVHTHHRMYQGAQGDLRPCRMRFQRGQRRMLRRNSNRSSGCTQGRMFLGTSENLSSCHQAGS